MRPIRVVIGLLFLAIGISALTGFDLFRYLVPLIFIIIGIKILTGRSMRGSCRHTSEFHQDELNEVLIFSGSQKHVVSSAFTGGKILVLISGIEIDLTEVKPKSKTLEMEIVSIFGGTKLIVPKGWNVSSEGVGILGGFSNETAGGSTNNPKLTLRGAAIFGGVDVVNQ